MREPQKTDWNKIGALAGVGAFVVAVVTLGVMLWPLVAPPDSETSLRYANLMTSWWPPAVIGACVLLAALFHLVAAFVSRGTKPVNSSVGPRIGGCPDTWLHEIAKDQAQTIYRFVALTRCLIGRHELLRPDPYLEFQMIVDNRSVYDIEFEELTGAISFHGRELTGTLKWTKEPDVLTWGNETSLAFRQSLSPSDVAHLLTHEQEQFDFSRLQITAKGRSAFASSVVSRPLNLPMPPTNEVLLAEYPKLEIEGNATYAFVIDMQGWETGDFTAKKPLVITLAVAIKNRRKEDVQVNTIRLATKFSDRNAILIAETGEIYEERIIDRNGKAQAGGERLKNIGNSPFVIVGHGETIGHLQFLIEGVEVLEAIGAVGTLTLVDTGGVPHQQTFDLKSRNS